MWGENGPYSQVRLCEETRILDDSVSRIFLVVEAEINPFTFEYVRKCRQQFANDEPVLQLLDHAEYRDKFGYIVSAGEIELEGDESRRFARKQTDMTTQTLIRMHAFVMAECGLKQGSKYGVIADKTFRDDRLIWNDEAGRADPVSDEFWDDTTFISSPAGIRGNKMRFFFVLPFESDFNFKKEPAVAFAKTLKKLSVSLNVEIESAESFMEYALVTALLPLDLAPANFIESVLSDVNTTEKRPIFMQNYFVTNVKKPTPDQIRTFLKQLPQ